MRTRHSTVVVVTFDDPTSALQWLHETECQYSIVCDTERKLYRHFGFRGCAVRETWSVRTQIWYAEARLAGRKLTPIRAGDDLHQMGGDVVVDAQSGVRWVYRSSTPDDRPSVEQLLKVVGEEKQ